MTKQADDSPAGSASEPGPVLPLGRGRLIARPGPDLYLYCFQSPGRPLPEIGRRGYFIYDGNSFPARLVDRRGPELAVSLTADRPLGPVLDGEFRPGPAPVFSPEIFEIEPEASRPAGAGLFLDPQEGWALGAAEAAGAKEALFEPEQWPAAPWADLPSRLSPAGVTFIWRQKPDEDSTAARTLIEHFSQVAGAEGHGAPARPGLRLLVLGDAPADLEPLADLPGAVYPGPARPGSPLHPISVYTKAAEAAEVRETELAVRRRELAEANRREAALKARLSQWDDLDQLAAKFQGLGREAAAGRERWDQAGRELDQARTAWEKAGLSLEGGGLKGWLRLGRSREPAVRREADRRRELEAAERAAAEARREEEEILAEARRLGNQLDDLRRQSESWTGREELRANLDLVRAETRRAADLVVAAQNRPLPRPEDILGRAPLTLALTADLCDPEGWFFGPGGPSGGQGRFGALLVLASQPRDHPGRLALAALALIPEKHLVILGDFTFWPVWNARPPRLPESPDTPAWKGLTAAEERDEFRTFLAEGGLFRKQGGPRPKAGGPLPARLEWPGPKPLGLGLRGPGEMGPANPVSALMVVRAALDFAAGQAGPGPAVIILTASPAQSLLINLTLADLEAPPGRVFCGGPGDFAHWPPAPLVILEPAFEAPHAGHPWAWPSFGRQRLMRAWSLARDQVWLAGRDDQLGRLPETSPLGALWRLAGRMPEGAETRPPAAERAVPPFWEALDRAKSEIWAVVPAFEAFWWRPLEEHFLAAAGRRVRVTLLSAPPGEGVDREYAAAAIRTLSAYGCSVHLAAGFPGFLAVVDGAHLSWGHFQEGAKGGRLWSGLESALLPLAAPALGQIMQIGLINEKMGRRGGGLKNCRACGWPLVLINPERDRGFSDGQPLKIGCLNNCRGSKNARRLDEREPFPAPPRCGLDRTTAYKRVRRGRREVWVCPEHPDGRHCPSHRVLDGDAE